MEEKKLKVKIRLLRAERSGKCQADNGGIHQSGVSDRTASIALKIVATERKLKQIHYLMWKVRRNIKQIEDNKAKRIIYQKYIKGWSLSSISKSLKIPRSTVYGRIKKYIE